MVTAELDARLASLDAKLDRVLLLLEADGTPAASRLLTAAQLAARLGVSRDHVYAHAEQYGAIRLGDGKRGRLRFPAEAVSVRLQGERSQDARTPASEQQSAPQARPVNGTRAAFRPIHAPKDP